MKKQGEYERVLDWGNSTQYNEPTYTPSAAINPTSDLFVKRKHKQSASHALRKRKKCKCRR